MINQTNHGNFTNLGSDFQEKFTKFYLENGFTLVRWKPSCAWWIFLKKKIFTFETQMRSHAKTSKDKQNKESEP